MLLTFSKFKSAYVSCSFFPVCGFVMRCAPCSHSFVVARSDGGTRAGDDDAHGNPNTRTYLTSYLPTYPSLFYLPYGFLSYLLTKRVRFTLLGLLCKKYALPIGWMSPKLA
jgi:hypothetical protein